MKTLAGDCGVGLVVTLSLQPGERRWNSVL